jgi:hypothetical protein
LPINPSPNPVSLGGSVAGQSVALELGLPTTGTISLNDTIVRQLALKPTQGTQISFSDFYNRATFENGSFFNGFNSWTVLNNRIYLGGNGGNTSILGYPTPLDPTAPSLDGGTMSNSNVFRSNVRSGGGVSGTLPWAELEIGTVTLQTAGGIVYGPAIISQFPVLASPGDRVSFDWVAFSSLSNVSAGDAYNIYSYIIDPTQNGRVFTIIDATAGAFNISKPWGTTTRVFGPGEGGSYYFVFIAGTYDATFGRVVGSRLGVTNIRLEKAGTF